MTEYEKRLDEADQENISVIENYDLSGTRLKGLYCDGSVALSNELETEAQKNCIMLEELGHHYTTVGNITDLKSINNRKQEQRARYWAYQRAISVIDLINGYKDGCRNRYELAEYLNVTEDFLQDALNSFKQKYGLCQSCGEYVIYFEPLAVLEIYK